KWLVSRGAGVSACAPLVDYVLTFTVSIASGCDQIWSVVAPELLRYKLPAEFGVLAMLLVLNLRGVKESVNILAPIFILFIITHSFAILYCVAAHFGGLPAIFRDAAFDFHTSIRSSGGLAVMLLLLRAYSLGGGTY